MASDGQDVRRRAPMACTFCQRRKMRCSNDQPRCLNCVSFDQDCVYSQTTRRTRAPSSRLSSLEEENRNLRHRLADPGAPSSSFGSRPGSRPVTPRTSLSDQPGTAHRSERRSSTLSSEDASKSRSLVYQGLTSASVLSDASASHPPSPSPSADFAVSPDDVRRELEKEAAQQRRLEATNFYSHSLDFDGVEPNLAMHLLSVHFNRQHHSFLVSYRPLFMRDMACGGPYFSKLLLNAIYFGASKFSSRLEVRSNPKDPSSAGWAYRQRSKDLLVPALDKSNITTVQALLILTNSLFAMGQEKQTAWLYAGMAVRMIIDLGMHVEDSSIFKTHRLSFDEVEIRRRVFWAGYVVDKIQSLYQGRPATLQAVTCRVPLTFLDQYEEEEHWQPVSFSGSVHYPEHPAHSVSTFTNLCKLSLIVERILIQVYAEQSLKRGPDGLAGDVKRLNEELEHWYTFLPGHLKFDPSNPSQVVPPPQVLSLLALYHVLRIQLHHPFVAKGHLYSATSSTARESFGVCATAATEIVQLLMAYDKTFSMAKAPYLIAYSTYVAATIHARIAAHKDEGSDAHANLRRCLAVLRENQSTNSGVASAIIALQSLTNSLGVDIGQVEDTQVGRESGLEEAAGQIYQSANPRNKAQPIAAGSYSHDLTLPHPPSGGDLGTQLLPADFDIDMILQGFAGADMSSLPPGSGYGPVRFDWYPEINAGQDTLMLDHVSTEAGYDNTLPTFTKPMAPNRSPDQYQM